MNLAYSEHAEKLGRCAGLMEFDSVKPISEFTWSAYAYVQSTYWDVGLLRYWRVRRGVRCECVRGVWAWGIGVCVGAGV